MAHPSADRLVYAFDVNFNDCNTITAAMLKVRYALDDVIKALSDTGIILKGNSVFRLLGAAALQNIEDAGLQIFADYKLFDVQSTITNDGSWLRLVPNLHILTVSEDVHPDVFPQLTAQLPKTIVAPINPLTDLGDEEFKRRGEKDRQTATRCFFKRVEKLRTKGLICSPKDIENMPKQLRAESVKICAGIRPSWAEVQGDTNAVNALTHQDAIRAGADILVVGSPLRYNNNLRGNTLRLLDEIGETLEAKRG